MSRRGPASLPAGYERGHVGEAEIVARSDLMPAVTAAVRARSLYQHAASHPSAYTMHGRGPVYAAPLLDGGPTVVVRHARHGGFFAPLTGDRFLGSTRAPAELRMSVQLAGIGIPTPTVIAYVVYPAGPLLHRSDVATLLIEPSADLATVLNGGARNIPREAAIAATTALLAAMARHGVRHPDLNLKNILLEASPTGPPRAYLLDVDRVRIESSRASASAASANAARLVRSANKWRKRHGVAISDAEIATLREAALGRPQ